MVPERVPGRHHERRRRGRFPPERGVERLIEYDSYRDRPGGAGPRDRRVRHGPAAGDAPSIQDGIHEQFRMSRPLYSGRSTALS
jgi:hypothetical protein